MPTVNIAKLNSKQIRATIQYVKGFTVYTLYVIRLPLKKA